LKENSKALQLLPIHVLMLVYCRTIKITIAKQATNISTL